jgi:hypothetical protein
MIELLLPLTPKNNFCKMLISIISCVLFQLPIEPVKLRWNPEKLESRGEKTKSLEVPHKLDVTSIFKVFFRTIILKL